MVIQEPLELSGVHLILRTKPNWDQLTKRSDGTAEGRGVKRERRKLLTARQKTPHKSSGQKWHGQDPSRRSPPPSSPLLCQSVSKVSSLRTRYQSKNLLLPILFLTSTRFFCIPQGVSGYLLHGHGHLYHVG